VTVCRGFIYAIGGYDGSTRVCLKSGERYHPGFDEWQPISSLIARRSGPAIVTKEQRQIYAIGGHDGRIVRKSVEVYDITRDRWHRVADMHIARRNAVAEVAYSRVEPCTPQHSTVQKVLCCI